MIKKTILYVFAVFVLLAILFYNTETNEKIKDILSKVNTIDQEMSRAGAKEKGLTELNQTYANYIKKLPKLFNFYDTDDKYLTSLETIEKLCNQNRINLLSINPNADNTITTSPDAIPEINNDFERYELKMRVRGNFINIGKLTEALIKKDFFIKSMSIKPMRNNNQVTSNINLTTYVRRPLKDSSNNLTLSEISSLISNPPKGRFVKSNMSWGRNIFAKQSNINNETSDFKIYSLTKVSTRNKTAEINFKTYKIGSKVDEYILSNIDQESATLSNNKRSIILALEKNEISSEFSMQGFKRAFLKARNGNQKTFVYKGKQYNTSIRK